MAETNNAAEEFDFETRLAALEKSVSALARRVMANAVKYEEIHKDVNRTLDNSTRVVAMLDEVLPLVRKAAPLLDSPMAKMAQSPAAGVLGLFTGGRRG